MEKAPDAFRTISEVADDLDVPQHVLRFWESRFTQIRPMKRGGGRRYYRPDDIALLRGIRHLLYGEGYTIRGAQRVLREEGIQFVQNVWRDDAPQPEPEEGIESAAAADEEIAPSPPTPAVTERREPTFRASPVRPKPREPAAINPQAYSKTDIDAHSAGLSLAQRNVLRSALEELAECHRLLDAAHTEQS